MMFATALIFYGLAILAAQMILTGLAQFDVLQSLFFRSLGGGAAGGMTAWYLAGSAPFISYLEACTNGDLSWGGYLLLVSLIAMIGVMLFNIKQYDGRAIV